VTTDEERWTRAEELLRGTPSRATTDGVRRRRLLVWAATVSAFLLVGGLGLGVALLVHDPHHVDPPDPPLWREITSLALFLASVIVMVIVLVSLRRAGQLGNAWRGPLTPLTRAQRKGLVRQVSGKEPVDPARLGLSRDLAVRLVVSGRVSGLLFLGLALGWVGRLVDEPTVGWAAFYGAVLLCWPVVLFSSRRQRQRAERFLAEHPAPDGEEPAER
jgi:hypothetical protein